MTNEKINALNFVELTDEELTEIVGGGQWQYIVDGISIGGALGGPQGALLGGVIGWAIYPTTVY